MPRAVAPEHAQATATLAVSVLALRKSGLAAESVIVLVGALAAIAVLALQITSRLRRG
jgi:hypothetical protein